MSPSLSGTPPSGSASTPPSARNLSSCWRLEALVSRPSIVSSFRLRRNPPPPALRSASRVASVSNSVASSGLSGSKLARSADALTLDGDPPGIVGAGLATPRPKPPAASAYPTFAAAAARLAAVDGGGGGAIARAVRADCILDPRAVSSAVSSLGLEDFVMSAHRRRVDTLDDAISARHRRRASPVPPAMLVCECGDRPASEYDRYRYRSAHSFEASADRDTGSPPRQEAVFA
mmetsp:Transcript_9804/g.44700  ORF Transcript_9804/g.44700 Transcript_9804/m.44700 type:complete len:233 (-) Transcript_9804:1129-1827(-)